MYQRKTKYFHIYTIGLLIPNDIIKLCLEFYHIVMRWDKCADSAMSMNPIKIKKDRPKT